MVKVNEKGEEIMSHGNGPSSIDSDGSFVVLERSTTQENHSLQFPNGSQLQSLRSMPPTSLLNPTRENPTSSLLSTSMPSLSPEEIQRKLQEVLQENIELKETLQQNNLAMKQQFNTLVMWQEEVFKVHQSHKEKFQETKELILKLKAENSELKNYLEKCGNASDIQLKEENARLKGQIAELQQKLSAPMPRRDHPHSAPTKKEDELTDLVKQLNTQLETAQRSRRQLGIDVESLTARRLKAEREIAELKATVQEYRQKCTVLQQANVELEEKLLQCERDMRSLVVVEKTDDKDYVSMAHKMQAMNLEVEKTRTEMAEVKKELDDEKEIKSRLLSQLQQQEAVLQELQKKLQMQGSLKQLQPSASSKETDVAQNLTQICEEQLKKLNGILFKQTERYANLNKWLQNTAANVRQWQPTMQTSEAQSVLALRSQIEQLMKLLAQEQAYSADMKILINENESNFQKLFADYQSLLIEWETYNQDENDKTRHNDAYHDVQAKGFTEKLDHLMAQVLCKDEELKESEKEIKELKEKLRKLELENEAIGILKAQVEVYQSDFIAEREARENLAGEKERLAEDLRHLQRRNQQLLDDLESYQRAQFEHIQNRSNDTSGGWSTIAAPGRGRLSPNMSNTGNPQTSSSTSDLRKRPSPEVEPSPPRIYDEDVPPPKEYVCPMCKMAFRQLGHLEYHIETCLDS